MKTLDAVTSVLMDKDDELGVPHAMKAVSGQMNLPSAIKVLDTQSLPRDVTGMVQVLSAGHAHKFDEASMDKARIALNDLIEEAWGRLDTKIFECKGFEDMNRATYGQVTRDIMRLIEQINDLERVESEAIEGISQQEQKIIELEAYLAHETKLYNMEYAENAAQLTLHQNDLDVFQFILEFTKPEGSTSLIQTKLCETQSGRKTLLFSNQATAAKYHKLMQMGEHAKKSIDKILRSVEAEALLQQPTNNTGTVAPPKEEVLGENGKACIGATGQTSSMGTEDLCMKACGPEPPDPPLLHDKLSLMWGQYKDEVDALTMEMMKNHVEFEDLKENVNAQIRMVVAAKARFQQLLAEARANLAADRAELKEKYKQRMELNKQYDGKMYACKKQITWIMYQDMCAIKVVRNAVLVNSSDCNTKDIVDCEMGAWIPGECDKTCDDDCDASKPFECGGWMTMTRDPITQPNACGLACPLMSKPIRCGQIKCPIDCGMSEWSGWSKCTAECEGGLQSHTRAIMEKPKNGGMQCNTVEESRPCNTGSCDRDCTLHAWTDWTPCSVACGGGFQSSFRHVLIPTRGEGRCPTDESSKRFREQQCNTHPCTGDEICIAQQDLVIGIDGSGSVREEGFKIIISYTKALLKRYQMQYFGQDAMKIGVLLFGNGIIMDDGKTVSPARLLTKLTSTMSEVETAVDGATWKQGFTNMAQAFSLAEDMFIKEQRENAQQSVLLVTDGRPSFAYMTNEMVEQLDDKGIMRYFLVINDAGPQSDVMQQMKRWASQPWETNLLHVQGLAMLEADEGLWVERALTMFCPMAYSPAQAYQQEVTFDFIHVKDSGWCGEKSTLLSMDKKNDAEKCAALASGAGAKAFVLGTWFRRGWCYVADVSCDEAQYNTWQNEKVNPVCNEDGGWKSSMLFDFYAMKPAGTA